MQKTEKSVSSVIQYIEKCITALKRAYISVAENYDCGRRVWTMFPHFLSSEMQP